MWSQAVVVWLAAMLAITAALLLMSEGEPVCTGPLILDVDDSDPPQCDGPLAGLAASMPAIVVAALFVAGIYLVVRGAVSNVRGRGGQPGSGR